MKRYFPSNLSLSFSLSALLLFASYQRSAAQAAPQLGSLRFANAAAIPGKVSFLIDNKPLRPAGFSPGENTSPFGFASGQHRFAASAPGAKSTEMNAALAPNTSTMMIVFSKPVVDPQTRQTIQQLQVFAQAEPPHETGKHFYFLYVSARPSVDLALNGQPRNLASLKLLRADDVSRKTILVESAGKPIVDFSANETGTFFVIIFDKPDGTVAGVVLPTYG